MTDSSCSQQEQETSVEDKSIFYEFIDNIVSVKTEDFAIRGTLRSIDGYLNTVLENVEFTTQTKKEQQILNLKTCFLAGGSIKHLNISK